MRFIAVPGGLRRTLLMGVMAAAISSASVAIAQTDAHVHGEGRLNIAIEADTIEMELTAPGSDIVGFEHPAETDDDKAAIHDAEATLKAAEKVFAFPGSAKCSLSKVVAEVPSGEHHDDDDHADHDHDDKKHDDHGDEKHDDHAAHDHGDEKHDEHGDEKHDDHGDEKHDDHAAHDHGDEKHDDHAADEHDEETHSEFRTLYRFQCADIDALTHIDLLYFQKFPRAQKLKVQALSENGQLGVDLTPDQNRLSF